MARRVWIALNAVSLIVAFLAATAWLTYPAEPRIATGYTGGPWYDPSRTREDDGLALIPGTSRVQGGAAWMRSRQWRTAYPSIFWLALVLPASAATLRGLDEYRRRRAAGRQGCRSCGYDLTGNVSGVCPECGTAVVGGNA